MQALKGISKRSRIALTISLVIMASFFVVQTAVVFNLCEPTYEIDLFGYCCILAFCPPFFMVVGEFLKKKNEVVEELGQKNVFLEHAAKIIRHDMHSGINTYIPRGIKSLKRRLTDEQLKELRITAPLQLIEDGASHAQKVYKGVYEFTNLVKADNKGLNKEEFCLIKSLMEYLRLTAYKSQVDLEKSPCYIVGNEPLLLTAIDNLIRNGLRYNDSKTKLVKIYQGYEEGGKHSICIKDNGRGIDQDDFDYLSKPYVRKAGQLESGTGLGLNICVEIIEQHGFTMSCEKTGSGTLIKIYYD